MIKLTEPVKDFELTTGAFLKHYCSLGIDCFYDIIENTWDGKPYKDLILYVSTPNSKDMYAVNGIRDKIVDELTDTENCFMGWYAEYRDYADIIRNRTVIVLRRYDDEDRFLY